MGFSAKQVRRRCGVNPTTATSAPVRPMAVNCPISRAGTRSRRPTGSSALMAGTGRRSNPNASLLVRTGAPSWRSISPESGSRCMPTAQPSFGKAMAPAKATAHHRARCTTSRSRSRKPMPPNGHWRPSASRSVLSSIGVARQPQYPRSPCPHRLLSLRLLSLGLPSPCPPMHTSAASTRTIRPLFHGRPATMAAARIWSPGIGRRVAVNWKSARQSAARLLSRPHPASSQRKSTRAFSPSPSPSGCVTKPI